MEEQLVTLAIHTYEKAHILKTILESEGIETYIQNVNQIQPVTSPGVRVKIKESDLPHALRIIKDVKWSNPNDTDHKDVSNIKKKILIPVDFSDYSMKACEIGFNHAYQIGAEVMLLHVYYSTYIPSSFPYLSYEMRGSGVEDSESVNTIFKRVQSDIDNLCVWLNRKINQGELPKIKYNYTLREGLPEEEIIAFSKEYNPGLIIMGTRGNKQKGIDLIGSVTGEIIEIVDTPLLAIPENISFDDFNKIKNWGFATSFKQKDLFAFEKFIELFNEYNFNIHLFNISTSKNEWNEIRLTGFCEHLKKQHPSLNISYSVLKDRELPEAIDAFVQEKLIDILVFSTHRRSTILRIFNPSIAHRMLFHRNTPLLVIPC